MNNLKKINVLNFLNRLKMVDFKSTSLFLSFSLSLLYPFLFPAGPLPQPDHPGAAADQPGRQPGRQQPALQGRGGRGRWG